MKTIQGGRRGSLLSILDRAETAMGSRLIRNWLEQPLARKEAIDARLDAVEELTRQPIAAAQMRQTLSGVYDIERLLSRIAYETVSPRECLALTASLDAIPLVQEQAQRLQGYVLRQLLEKMDQLDELRGTLRRAIDPEAPLLIRDGGIFLKGYNDELDELRDITRCV